MRHDRIELDVLETLQGGNRLHAGYSPNHNCLIMRASEEEALMETHALNLLLVGFEHIHQLQIPGQ